MRTRVFVDTDVIISASLSKTGAAYHLLHNVILLGLISNFSVEEALRTAKKLGIDPQNIHKQLGSYTAISIKATLKAIRQEYGQYVNDINDAHVIAGAVHSKSSFLVTYNLKDFKIELMKRELDIIVLSPGTLLQYVRSKK